MKEIIISFVLGYALNWRLGRKYLYPILDRELDANATRFQIFINHARIICRHWLSEAKGLGHNSSPFNCLEADCAILNGQTYEQQNLQQSQAL